MPECLTAKTTARHSRSMTPRTHGMQVDIYDGLETSYAAGRGSSCRMVGDFCENKNKLLCYEASHHERVKAYRVTAFAEFQSHKLCPGETVPGCSYAGTDEDSKNKTLYQQFLVGVPDECSRVTALPHGSSPRAIATTVVEGPTIGTNVGSTAAETTSSAIAKGVRSAIVPHRLSPLTK